MCERSRLYVFTHSHGVCIFYVYVCVCVCDRQRTIPYTFLAVWHVFGCCSAHACDDRCKPVCIWNEINYIVTIHHFDHFFLSVACVLDKTHKTHTLKTPMSKLHYPFKCIYLHFLFALFCLHWNFNESANAFIENTIQSSLGKHINCW